ncbi:hypothetical protein BKA64DRAFT_711776 [Cadophora sp. MPI-SDFR-AT-0126]|nr:hypothetical protein BKA64DRAFT_711776 [Leotiomycetes sp. MPI-SDFR-AT-0126]
MAELGAIASIVGIAAAGAKLSMVLFEFGSTVGSARTEVNQIATEISQFCAVLKQLHSTLTKAKAHRYSVSAIATTQDILKRCQEIFKEIEDIVHPLLNSAGKSKEPPVDVIARMKWTFRRSKVQVLQKTLESSKNTLQLMLVSTIAEQLEDEQEQAVIQGLIIANRCAVDELETLENEAEEQDEEKYDPPGTRTSEVKRIIKSKRASVWANSLIFDNSPLPSGFRRNTWGDTASAPTIASQAHYLVQAWTTRIPEISKDLNQDQSKGSGPVMEISKEKPGNDSAAPPTPLVQPQNLEKPPNLFYAEAIYDYETDYQAAVSFHKGDIIQVLGMHESGWWDGVINDVRGWFPSNYCRLILKPDHKSNATHHESDSEDSDSDEDYDQVSDAIQSDGLATKVKPTADFWIPQATPDGRLFYFNTWTGESVTELPNEVNSDSIPQAVADEGADKALSFFNTETGESAMEIQDEVNYHWIPQATPDGRLFYYNIETGEESKDPP